MCGRYVIARSVDDLLFDVGAVAGEPFRDTDHGQVRENWNVAPTTEVPVVLERPAGDGDSGKDGSGEDDGAGGVLRELHLASWGLIPGWAKDASIGSRAFNARSETVLEKPMFRSAIRHRRCAVPANGYYEWKKRLAADGTPVKGTKNSPAKQPYFVHPNRTEENIWFAGIYEWWRSPDGQWVLSCSILTMEAPPADCATPVLGELGRLHDRLPIPLNRPTLGAWLDPGAQSNPESEELVQRVQGEAYDCAAAWQLHAVGADVGNVRNNRPDLIQPASALF